MILKIENQSYEFENTKEGLDQMLGKVETTIEKASRILGHMVIDYIEVYEDYYSYLQDNLNTIGEVQVITLTYKELVDEIISSAVVYLRGAAGQIEDLSNSFYREPTGEDWDKLKDLLTAISWLMSSFSSIDSDSRLNFVVSSYESWNEYAGTIHLFTDILADLEGAIADQDNVGMADLLQYEIAPLFVEMEEKLSQLVTVEDTHDFS